MVKFWHNGALSVPRCISFKQLVVLNIQEPKKLQCFFCRRRIYFGPLCLDLCVSLIKTTGTNIECLPPGHNIKSTSSIGNFENVVFPFIHILQLFSQRRELCTAQRLIRVDKLFKMQFIFYFNWNKSTVIKKKSLLTTQPSQTTSHSQ